MSDFPDIQLPSSRKRTFVREMHRTAFSDGKVLSRSKFSEGRWKWTLSWELLNRADAMLLQQHFDAHAGPSFNCAAKMLDVATDVEVTYAMEEIVLDSTGASNHFKVQVILEEA